MASKLPVEVVAHIMSFLGLPDRKEAALVSRSWYEASLDPALQENIRVNFSYEKTAEILESFHRRRLTHLILSHFDNSSINKNAVLKSCELGSDDLRSLSLKDSHITEGTLAQLLSKCPQLRSLDLSGCDSLFMAGTLLNNNEQVTHLQTVMSNVTELDLSCLRFLSDRAFIRLLAIFPNLENISLAGTQITYNSHAYYPQDATVFENSAVFTFHCIESFISNHVNKLKALNLSRTALTNQHLGQLAHIPNLVLEELYLIGCRDVGNEGLNQLCQHQKSLRKLDVSGCMEVSDIGLSVVAMHLTKLETLNINKCRQITDSSVKLLKNLHNLQHVDLSECYELTSKGLTQGVCDRIKSHLTYLNLSCCSLLDTNVVIHLAQCSPLLQHLDLGSCFLLQDAGLHVISNTLHYLHTLRLAWCKALTNLGLLGMQANGLCPIHDPVTSSVEGQCNCTRKSKMPVIFRKPTTAIREKNEALLKEMIGKTEMTEIPENLSSLIHLRILDLSSCIQLTDLGLSGAIKFAELRVLKLNMLHGLTDSGLIDIACNNTGLEELQLQQCARVSDAAISVVTLRCHRLSHLDISNCDKLTDTSLLHIQDNCKRLRYLNVSFCSGLTPQAVDLLENNLRSLETIVRRNVGISNVPLISNSIHKSNSGSRLWKM